MNFHLNIKRINLEEYIPFLKENKYKIWGTDVTNGIDIKNASKDEKYAIIMGNEGKGMSANIKELCDKPKNFKRLFNTIEIMEEYIICGS